MIEKEWNTKAGLPAFVMFVKNSHRCGYVKVTRDHFLFEVDLYELPHFYVHGGVTFSDFVDDFWNIGFDCAHFGDKAFGHEGVERTLDYCIEECENLAAQIEELKGTPADYYFRSKKIGKLSEEYHNKMIAFAIENEYYAKKYFDELK